ncbi:MAG: glycosyltransferase family 39 protein [Candidatus Eisenbacteria sp.]|nr:glycosyltransferase family 39 protein [Candidatus Eisenbacteria bacterium]
MSKRREIILLLAILVLGAGLRLTFALQHTDIDIAFDQKFYYRQAVALAGQGTLPEDYVVRPPVYVGFLSAVVRLFGPSVNAIRITQALLSILGLWACFLLARRLLGSKLALVCTGILAIYPASIIGPWLILTEFIFTPLLLLAIWAVARALNEPGERKWILVSAVFWGLAALTRAVAAGYFALVLIVFLILSRRIRIPRKTVLLAGVTFLLVISPWTIRNYARYGGFMLIDNTAAFNLWLTNTPDIPIREFSRDYWQKIENPVQRQREGMREGLKSIRSDPAYYTKHCGRRFSKFWSASGLYPTIDVRKQMSPRGVGLCRRILAKTSAPMFWVVLVPALAGAAFSLRRGRYLILSGFIAYLTVAHSLLVANARHRSPLTPLLIILAVYGACEFVRRIWASGRSS